MTDGEEIGDGSAVDNSMALSIAAYSIMHVRLVGEEVGVGPLGMVSRSIDIEAKYGFPDALIIALKAFTLEGSGSKDELVGIKVFVCKLFSANTYHTSFCDATTHDLITIDIGTAELLEILLELVVDVLSWH